MKQSDQRVPRRGEGLPPSFGRQNDEPPPAEDFRIVGGQAFMTLHVDAIPSAESLAGLYDLVKATVSRAIRDAYAETVGVALPEPPGDGGAPAG